MVAGYLLGVQFAHVRGTITEEKYEELLAALQELPDQIAKLLEDDKERIQWFAAKYANAKDVFFIGRGIDYAVSMEGSLKLKENQLHPFRSVCSRRIKTRNHQPD